MPQLRPFIVDDDRARSGGRGETPVGAGSRPAPGGVAGAARGRDAVRRRRRSKRRCGALAEERGIKAGTLIHATRVAGHRPGRESRALRGARAGRTRSRAAPVGSPWLIRRHARFTEADFVRARRILMRRDPRLGVVIKRVGRCALPDGRTHEPFAGLVRVIMAQQLSGKAAETIFGRVAALVGGARRPHAGGGARPGRSRAAGRGRQPAEDLVPV